MPSSPPSSAALAPAMRVDAPVDAHTFRLLPRSCAARLAVWLVMALALALVFGAWLRPNMIFDLADMVFCN